jgi:DNA replication protein DnaC
LQLIKTENGVKTCQCVQARKRENLIRRANIPPRYEHTILDNFEPNYSGANPSLSKALIFARRFAEGYPIGTKGQGLLIAGSVGTGKTHLSIGIMRVLMEQYGVRCAFYDHHALMKEIQATYKADQGPSEDAILQPVLDTEVVVIDDLGIMKFSEWTANTLSLILSKRYNDKLTTILTTNYPNEPETPSNVTEIRREQTLGDRITDRLHSRLAQMCIPLNVRGKDFRRTVGRASPGA